MKLNYFKQIFFATILVLNLSSCEHETPSFEEDFSANISLFANGEVSAISGHCLVVDETNPSNMYGRVDSIKIYGYGIEYVLPDSIKESDLTLIISGKWRETESITGNVAIGLHNIKDSILYFNTLNAKDYINALNKWVPFADTFYISKSQNNANAKLIRVFSGKPNGKGFLDVDDLKITITKL